MKEQAKIARKAIERLWEHLDEQTLLNRVTNRRVEITTSSLEPKRNMCDETRLLINKLKGQEKKK